MAAWKQLILVVVLAVAGLVGWGAADPSARARLLALGVPAAVLPEALFLAKFETSEATATTPGAGRDPARTGSQAAGRGDGSARGAGGRPGAGGPGAGAPGGRGGAGPVTVVTAAAVPGLTNDRVTAIGTGEAARTVTVFPRSTGMVDEIRFSAGERVEAGAVLVTLDDDAERIALERAEVTLADARAKVERYERLTETKALSTVERDAARSELASAELAIREARLDLDRRTITAPLAGVAGLTDVEVGDMVSATTAIVTIDDRSSLKIEFRVPESVAAKVAVGQSVEATTPSRPGETFTGEVSALGSRIEVDSRTLVVQARVANDGDALRPGMSFLVTLRFPGDSKTAVPAMALQWDRDGSYVWRVVDGKAERVGVTIVERSVDTVLLEGPLALGDSVVVEGVQRLRPGAAVALAGPTPDAGAPAAGEPPAAPRRG